MKIVHEVQSRYSSLVKGNEIQTYKSTWNPFKKSTSRRTQVGYVSEWVSSVLRPRQHSIGYMGDGFTGQTPNQQYQSTEGDATKEKENNENN